MTRFVQPLFASEFQPSFDEPFADFVQTCHPKVFALHEVLGSPANQFTNGHDAKFGCALSRPN
jgi:hypothetical protein